MLYTILLMFFDTVYYTCFLYIIHYMYSNILLIYYNIHIHVNIHARIGTCVVVVIVILLLFSF